MITRQVRRTKPYLYRLLQQPQWATFWFLGAIACVLVICFAWITNSWGISHVFHILNNWQQEASEWFKAPSVDAGWKLSLVLLLVAQVIIRISPQPQTWSRFLVVTGLLVLTVRYLLWRSLTTLNLSTPTEGIFSLVLFFFELVVVTGSIISLVLLLWFRDRRAEADKMSVNVLNGTFRPTVDILIPTYNEPAFVLRRTVIGCQALDYDLKKIYLLDDTRRPEIKALAEELGCTYITRPSNRHAKAGNLNYAIARTQGELIVVFDADFVPTKNFLTRTIGFFQQPQIALVQTPQSFYNHDPIARNLGLEKVLPPEEEIFYRQIQPMRDGAGGLICSGTSFVVRRSALVETGGFTTESLSEDFFTGIRLAARGYQLIYLNEKLSAGLAAESMAYHALQRARWGQGTLQAFFVKSNPLTIPGLNLLQRLAYLEGILQWFNTISRVAFLTAPLACSFLMVSPLRITNADIFYFFVPYYLVNLSVVSWLNYKSRSAFMSDVYSTVLCFPLAVAVIKTMLNPFGKGFKVTPKGTAKNHFSYNWQLAFPLIVFFVANALSVWSILKIKFLENTGQADALTVAPEQLEGIDTVLFWSIYNLLILGVCLFSLLDIPRPSVYEWFKVRRDVQLRVGEKSFIGSTTAISEIGADISLKDSDLLELKQTFKLPSNQNGNGSFVRLEIPDAGLVLEGIIASNGDGDDHSHLRIMFERVSLEQQRLLIQMLYCTPEQWKHRNAPGELRSLWLLFRSLLRPIVGGRWQVAGIGDEIASKRFQANELS